MCLGDHGRPSSHSTPVGEPQKGSCIRPRAEPSERKSRRPSPCVPRGRPAARLPPHAGVGATGSPRNPLTGHCPGDKAETFLRPRQLWSSAGSESRASPRSPGVYLRDTLAACTGCLSAAQAPPPKKDRHSAQQEPRQPPCGPRHAGCFSFEHGFSGIFPKTLRYHEKRPGFEILHYLAKLPLNIDQQFHAGTPVAGGRRRKTSDF